MSPRVRVAGIGNVFLGDDGFGVEVAERLGKEPLPRGVTVVADGIRGLHLAFELLDPPDLLIAVDAVSRGGPPGTLYVIDPAEEPLPPMQADGHGLDLPGVFASVLAMGGTLPPIRVVGCEVQDVSEGMGLSAVVEAAVPGAVALVRELFTRALSEGAQQEVVP